MNMTEGIKRELFRLPRRFYVQNEREYRIFAMKRSGQHAIIHWILKHSPGRSLFLNNVFLERNPGTYSGFTERQIKLDRSGLWLPKDLYAFSIEDADLRISPSVLQATTGHWGRGRSRSVRQIYIVRDPLNLFASRRKKYASAHMYDAESIELCKKYFRQLLGRSQYLDADALAINFNLWVLSQDYRTSLGDELGLVGSYSASYEPVHGYGGGSSFDDRTATSESNKQDLFDRWRSLSDPSDLSRVANDDEMADMASEIFSGVHDAYSDWLKRARTSAP